MMFVKANEKKEEKGLWLELLQLFMFGMVVVLVTACGLAWAPEITFAIAGAVASFAGIMLGAWMLVTCLEVYEKQA